MQLTDVQKKLAEQLLLTVINRENVVEYNELGSRIDPPIFQRNVGREIGEVSKLCHKLGLPLLSAKVTRKGQGKAGDGFYGLMKELGIDTSGKTERELFTQELKKIRESTEWQKLADYLELDLRFSNAPEIRILPMSRVEEFTYEEYETIHEIQEKYFLGELIDRNGLYYFRERGLLSPIGSLVLFQIEASIIASAILSGYEKYDEPYDDLYWGALIFDVNSIEVFEPIEAEEIYDIDETFTGFSHKKHRWNYSYLERFRALIASKKQIMFPDELSANETIKCPEGAKTQVIVNVYERNPVARKECIRIHGSKCSICGFDFGKAYGNEFSGRIHVHHIKPLHTLNGEYEVDPEHDLIPVCPNCHMVIHLMTDEENPVEKIKHIVKNIKR